MIDVAPPLIEAPPVARLRRWRRLAALYASSSASSVAATPPADALDGWLKLHTCSDVYSFNGYPIDFLETLIAVEAALVLAVVGAYPEDRRHLCALCRRPRRHVCVTDAPPARLTSRRDRRRSSAQARCLSSRRMGDGVSQAATLP